MGLDMYAARRLYVKQWEHQSPSERYKVSVTRGGKPAPGIQSRRISAVEEEVMYWRKANHIHGWFVDNVQSGIDDGKEYYVSQACLRALVQTCAKVIRASKLVDGMVLVGKWWKPGMPSAEEQREPGKVIQDPSVAKELLPTRAGCFFGSMEYDQFYLKDVRETMRWAMRMLEDIESGVLGDVYYSSSW